MDLSVKAQRQAYNIIRQHPNLGPDSWLKALIAYLQGQDFQETSAGSVPTLAALAGLGGTLWRQIGNQITTALFREVQRANGVRVAYDSGAANVVAKFTAMVAGAAGPFAAYFAALVEYAYVHGNESRQKDYSAMATRAIEQAQMRA